MSEELITLYRVPEVAKRLRLSPAQVYNLIAAANRGLPGIASIKIGRSRRVRASALREYLDSLEAVD